MNKIEERKGSKRRCEKSRKRKRKKREEREWRSEGGASDVSVPDMSRTLARTKAEVKPPK